MGRIPHLRTQFGEKFFRAVLYQWQLVQRGRGWEDLSGELNEDGERA